jgi:hypothetical protein
MSSISEIKTETEVCVEEVAVAKKRVALSAKYSKFLVFGHWFTSVLHREGLLTSADAVDTALVHLTAFADVAAQSAFFQTFLDEAGDATKDLKSRVKSRAKSEKEESKTKKGKKTESESKGKKTVTKGKKSSALVVTESDQLVADLVAAANSEEVAAVPVPVVAQPVAEPVGAAAPKRKPAAKKPKVEVAVAVAAAPAVETNTNIQVQPKTKPKKAKAIEAVGALIASASATVDEKPKAEANEKAAKKAKAAEKPKAKANENAAKKAEKPKAEAAEKAAEPEPVDNGKERDPESDSDDDEINARVFHYKGEEFLIDDAGCVYDKESFDVIGSYDATTDTLTRVCP